MTAVASRELLDTIANLSRFHRLHEEYYASSPRDDAVRLQTHARTLQALADQWSSTEVSDRVAASPFEGAEDLNHPVALQLDGVLFMEGQGRPPEVDRLLADLRATASSYEATGEWLAGAMEAAWAMAAALLPIDGLADLLGERHRIIANDWQAASMSSLAARLLGRAAELLDVVDFDPAALRVDLAGARSTPSRLLSAAELIGRSADLCSDSAGLVRDNERRWRVFRARVVALLAAP